MIERSDRLREKNIALCITGSVAAVESVKLARELRRHGAGVTAFMTRGAQDIIHPNALEFATGHAPVTRLSGSLEHLIKFDLIVVAPATANTIAKIAHGIADNPVATLAVSSGCKVIIAPAMHREMQINPVVVKNIRSLGEQFIIVEPFLEEDAAKMAPIDELVDTAISALTKKDLAGKSVVITAGPTAEPIDPVRIITNRSSGKMGIALAKEAVYRGAKVTLINGPGSEKPPEKIHTIHVNTAQEMADVVKKQKNPDIFIGAAAVSDFSARPFNEKINSRKGKLSLTLAPTQKILSLVEGSGKKVGFKAEHDVTEENLISKAKTLLEIHDLDLVVANDISKDIFASDETEAILVDGRGNERLGRLKKSELATIIFDRLLGK